MINHIKREAKNKGLLIYYDNKPCPKGHLTGRYVSTGMCVHCTKEKSIISEIKRRKTPQYKEYHKIYYRSYMLDYQKNNLKYRLRIILRRRLAAAIKNKQKKGSAVELLGIPVEHLIYNFKNLGFDWKFHGKGPGTWQIDHIKPLCDFDLTKLEQLKTACHYSNLQPLWYEDHLQKHKDYK